MESGLSVGEIVKILTPDDKLYLERMVLGHQADGSKLFVHYIHQSDQDRHPHDHPWDFKSLILHGGYYDKVPIFAVNDGSGRMGRREEFEDVMGPDLIFSHYSKNLLTRGMWNHKTTRQLHAVELLDPTQPTITLVWAGPKKAEWGFFTEDGWVHNQEYTKDNHNQPKVVD